MIRVIVADDHHLVRQGIRALLEKPGDIDVVGESEDGLATVELVARLKPDVVLVDIAMPGLNGIEVARRIRELAIPTQVVILSVHSDPALVRQALRHGASGYLLKSALKEELLQAVRAASQGSTFLSPEISQHAPTDPPAGPEEADALQLLSPRERQVLQLIAEGNTNKRIAQKLKVSAKTIEKHRANLMVKLKLHDVTGLVRFAIQHRLIFLDNQGSVPDLLEK
jgi:DNA-binding NarL/FixJ family response regulator